MIWILGSLAVIGAGLSAPRWLRLAQREHYLPGVSRFAWLWWLIDGRNRSLLGIGIVSVVAAAFIPVLGTGAAAVAVVGPLGLGLRGRTSPLTWTGRLRRLAILTGVIVLGIVGVGIAAGLAPLVAFVPLALPLVVDLSLVLIAPYERRQGDRWVEQAAASLQRVAPAIVAITGSYGKTSTKNLVAHLLGGTRAVVASPASFNNRMGLARAVNEHLATGTEVFVAEMGTYGPGEIRSLCSWVRPDVAVITALGPVHLERMGSLEAIAAAKREILENAPVAVIATEHPLLAAIADEESRTRRIIRVSVGHTEADVVATTDGSLIVEGEVIGTFDPTQAQPGNVAAAVGVAIALGIDPRVIVPRLADLPVVPHRQAIGRSERGFVVIDDTFNANPAGAKAALSLLSRRGSDSGRRVVVTPGMVELGREQFEANRAFAAEAGAAGVTHLLVVNRTNRAALLKGAEEGGVGTVILFETRDEAVRWVRETLVDGDAVLYENDLPDHYP
jgi:UDP-N-acetylmuramoyl-tripeptide--D-alanyl-D-alanine ligase